MKIQVVFFSVVNLPCFIDFYFIAASLVLWSFFIYYVNRKKSIFQIPWNYLGKLLTSILYIWLYVFIVIGVIQLIFHKLFLNNNWIIKRCFWLRIFYTHYIINFSYWYNKSHNTVLATVTFWTELTCVEINRIGI